MNPETLDGYGASPIALPITLIVALLLSLLVGAVLLVLVVRWTEGFAMSFWSALKLTAVAVVAAIACQILVVFATFNLGYGTMAAYWSALLITTLVALFVYTAIYAYGVKKPGGEPIGMIRAIKVTLVQLALSVAICIAIAFVVAALILAGVVEMPELPPGIL